MLALVFSKFFSTASTVGNRFQLPYTEGNAQSISDPQCLMQTAQCSITHMSSFIKSYPKCVIPAQTKVNFIYLEVAALLGGSPKVLVGLTSYFPLYPPAELLPSLPCFISGSLFVPTN